MWARGYPNLVMVPTWYRIGARVRGVLSRSGLLGVVVGVPGMLVLPDVEPLETIMAMLAAGGFVLLVLGLVLSVLPGGPRIEPRVVSPPVAGRWLAVNSPASKVPSHGTHGYGQTFAIDLAYEPEPGARPAFGAGKAFRPPQDFPAFGRPLHSPVDGTVVAVRSSGRDHRSRSTWPALIYLMVLEGFAREVAGPGQVLGNHVVLDAGDGVYATLAHLQRGSVAVSPGQRVRRGDVVGRCGNSGNSTEPHVHFQLQDHRSSLIAAGVPFAFDGVPVPPNEEALEVPTSGQSQEARDQAPRSVGGR